MCWSFRTLAEVGRQLSSELVGSEAQLNPLCLRGRHHLPTFLPGNIPDSSWLPSVERSIHLKSNQPEKPVFQLNLTIFHQDTERLVLEWFKQPRNPREPEGQPRILSPSPKQHASDYTPQVCSGLGETGEEICVVVKPKKSGLPSRSGNLKTREKPLSHFFVSLSE